MRTRVEPKTISVRIIEVVLFITKEKTSQRTVLAHSGFNHLLYTNGLIALKMDDKILSGI